MTMTSFAFVQRWFCLCAALLIVAVLFYLGARPIAVGLFPGPFDKLAHLVLYFVIATLLWIAFDGRLPLLTVALASFIGALDEWHQASLPGRSADFADLLADVVAAVLAVALLRWWRR